MTTEQKNNLQQQRNNNARQKLNLTINTGQEIRKILKTSDEITNEMRTNIEKYYNDILSNRIFPNDKHQEFEFCSGDIKDYKVYSFEIASITRFLKALETLNNITPGDYKSILSIKANILEYFAKIVSLRRWSTFQIYFRVRNNHISIELVNYMCNNRIFLSSEQEDLLYSIVAGSSIKDQLDFYIKLFKKIKEINLHFDDGWFLSSVYDINYKNIQNVKDPDEFFALLDTAAQIYDTHREHFSVWGRNHNNNNANYYSFKYYIQILKDPNFNKFFNYIIESLKEKDILDYLPYLNFVRDAKKNKDNDIPADYTVQYGKEILGKGTCEELIKTDIIGDFKQGVSEISKIPGWYKPYFGSMEYHTGSNVTMYPLYDEYRRYRDNYRIFREKSYSAENCLYRKITPKISVFINDPFEVMHYLLFLSKIIKTGSHEKVRINDNVIQEILIFFQNYKIEIS